MQKGKEGRMDKLQPMAAWGWGLGGARGVWVQSPWSPCALRGVQNG